MKNIGLEKFLKKIEDDPVNQILINRYLLLLKDLEDKQLQLEYALKLAQVLVESDPKKAIEIAYAVYKADISMLESLEVIATGFKKLGRLAKAEVVLNELNKLKQAQKTVLMTEETASDDQDTDEKNIQVQEDVNYVFYKDSVSEKDLPNNVDNKEIFISNISDNSLTKAQKGPNIVDSKENIKEIFNQIEIDFVEQNKELKKEYNTNLNEIFFIPSKQFSENINQLDNKKDSKPQFEKELIISSDNNDLQNNKSSAKKDNTKDIQHINLSSKRDDNIIKNDQEVNIININIDNQSIDIDISQLERNVDANQPFAKDNFVLISQKKEESINQDIDSILLDSNVDIKEILSDEVKVSSQASKEALDNAKNIQSQKNNKKNVLNMDSNLSQKSPINFNVSSQDNDKDNSEFLNHKDKSCISKDLSLKASDNLSIDDIVSDSIYHEKIDSEVLSEMFDFYWKHSLIDEAQKLLDKTEKFAKNSAWWKSRKLILLSYLKKNKK